MMFLEGYIGAPPTVTVCSFICANVVAAPEIRASAASATAVGTIRESLIFHSPSVICDCAAAAACKRRYGGSDGRMQAGPVHKPVSLPLAMTGPVGRPVGEPPWGSGET